MKTISERVLSANGEIESAVWDIEKIKYEICRGYCKYREQVYSDVKDVKDADELLMSTQCEKCPLMGL